MKFLLELGLLSVDKNGPMLEILIISNKAFISIIKKRIYICSFLLLLIKLKISKNNFKTLINSSFFIFEFNLFTEILSFKLFLEREN